MKTKNIHIAISGEKIGESYEHTHTCVCGHEVEVSSSDRIWGKATTEEVPHTQEDNGGTRMSVTCEVCGYTAQFYSRPTGHIFNSLKYVEGKWVLKCETCEKEIKFDNLSDYFTVTDPTCTEWAKVKFNKKDQNNSNVYKTETNAKDLCSTLNIDEGTAKSLGLAPLGHKWTEITDEDVNWNIEKNEYNEVTEVTATATVVCKNDEEHKENVTAKLSETTVVKKETFKDVTCEDEGQYDFTATFNLNDGTTVMTADYSETISALGHHFVSLTYIGSMFDTKYNKWSLNCTNGWSWNSDKRVHNHAVTFDNVTDYFDIVKEPTCTEYAVIKFKDNGTDKSDIYTDETDVSTIANNSVFVSTDTLANKPDALRKLIISTGLLKDHEKNGAHDWRASSSTRFDLMCAVCDNASVDNKSSLKAVFEKDTEAVITINKGATLKLTEDVTIPEGTTLKVTAESTLDLDTHTLTVAGKGGVVFEDGSKLQGTSGGKIDNTENVEGYDKVEKDLAENVKLEFNLDEESLSSSSFSLSEILADKHTDKVNLNADAEISETTTVAENATLVLGNGTTLTVPEGQELTINGEVKLSDVEAVAMALETTGKGKILNSGTVTVADAMKLNCPVVNEGEGSVEFITVDATAAVEKAKQTVSNWINKEHDGLEGSYVEIGGYFDESNQEGVKGLILPPTDEHTVIIQANEEKKTESIPMSVSLGNNNFATGPVWRINQQHRLEVSLPWLISMVEFGYSLDFGKNLESVGFTFDEIKVAEEENYNDLEVDTDGAKIIGNGNETKASVQYNPDGFEDDDGSYYELEYKATKYNIAYGLNLKIADEETEIDDEDLIYRLSLDDGTVAITKNEKKVSGINCTFASYPFEWKQDPEFDKPKDEIRDFILVIPGKGSIEIIGRFQLVETLE